MVGVLWLSKTSDGLVAKRVPAASSFFARASDPFDHETMINSIISTGSDPGDERFAASFPW